MQETIWQKRHKIHLHHLAKFIEKWFSKNFIGKKLWTFDVVSYYVILNVKFYEVKTVNLKVKGESSSSKILKFQLFLQKFWSNGILTEWKFSKFSLDRTKPV